MIVVKLQGGLGNQLFQYAFGRNLALKRGEELLLDEAGLNSQQVIRRNYSLAPFNIAANVGRPEQIKKIKYPLGVFSELIRIFQSKILRLFYIGWNPQLLISRKRYFVGFFQSYKYLEPIRERLLTEISLKDGLSDKYNDLIEKMASTNSVSLHVRRGDFISDPYTKAAHYTFGLEYYEAAIELMNSKISNPVYFVFSDDIAWVKENLKINSSVIFVSAPSTRDFEELILMSHCQNNIIANSSFSFWGAWLNQNPAKIVIAPKKWNNVYVNEYKDLLPPEWFKI